MNMVKHQFQRFCNMIPVRKNNFWIILHDGYHKLLAFYQRIDVFPIHYHPQSEKAKQPAPLQCENDMIRGVNDALF